jgi:dihydroorotate dehydrogenase electron transfer subunit
VGKGTEILASRRPGQEIDLLGPLGKGFSIPFDPGSVLLVAGGMGVAPLRALAARLCSLPQGSGAQDHGADLGAKVTAIIGGKGSRDILCAEELRRLGTEVQVSTEDGSLGRRGLATDLVGEHLSKPASTNDLPSIIYACGPRPMLAKVAQMASAAQIPCQVSLEEYMACGIGACMGCVVKTRAEGIPYQLVCKDGPVFEAERIEW